MQSQRKTATPCERMPPLASAVVGQDTLAGRTSALPVILSDVGKVTTIFQFVQVFFVKNGCKSVI